MMDECKIGIRILALEDQRHLDVSDILVSNLPGKHNLRSHRNHPFHPAEGLSGWAKRVKKSGETAREWYCEQQRRIQNRRW